MDESKRDLNYWKENAKDQYIKTPICVLRYINELENALEKTKPCQCDSHTHK